MRPVFLGVYRMRDSLLKSKSAKGFTLIEVLIVVAIVGILAAIANPIYVEYVQRGHRASAKSALMSVAQWMERAATAQGFYPAANNVPDDLLTVEGGLYSITIVVPQGGAAYTLTATVKAGSSQSTDKCGNFTLDQAGIRGVSGSEDDAECWNR